MYLFQKVLKKQSLTFFFVADVVCFPHKLNVLPGIRVEGDLVVGVWQFIFNTGEKKIS